MLESIAQKGNARQRTRALRTLSISNSIVTARVGFDETNRPERQAARSQRLLGLGSVVKEVVGGTPLRTIMTADHTQRPTGPVLRAEGDPATGDLAVDEAYDYMGATYDFYW